MIPAIRLISVLLLSSAASAQVARLSCLTRECHIRQTAIQYFGTSKQAVVLDCGCRPVVITGPASLQGLVQISNADQALEFVRFFSTWEKSTLFEMGGMVEIAGFGAGGRTTDGRFLVPEIYEPLFGQKFVRARVREETGPLVRQFAVTRTVVEGHGRVLEIEEVVSASGNYSVRSRTILLDNAMSIGITNFDPL
jgi:hypothetical protein